MPPWPASRNTVIWRSPSVGGKLSQAPEAKYDGSIAVAPALVAAEGVGFVRLSNVPRATVSAVTTSTMTTRMATTTHRFLRWVGRGDGDRCAGDLRSRDTH
jgi:hypothetical protein